MEYMKVTKRGEGVERGEKGREERGVGMIIFGVRRATFV
jgi:hypothetical protein